MLSSNFDLERVLSYTKDGVYNTGKAFQIQRRFTIASSATYYVALDITPLTAVGRVFGSFPLSLSSTAGLILLDAYKSTLTVTGTELTPLRINESITVTSPLAKFYYGSTPATVSPTNPRQYAIGTKSTNQSSGSGATVVDIVKEFSTESPIVLKFVNQETSDNILTLGWVWFEV